LYGRFVRRQYATAFCFLGVSISLLIVPHTSTLLQIYIGVGSLGFFVGGYRTAEAVWLVEMWQSKSGPFLQCQHFFWALGTALPPFILTPFLSSSTNNLDQSSSDSDDLSQKESRSLFIPFTIAGCMTLCTFLFEIFLLMCYPYRKPRRDSQQQSEEVHSDSEKQIDSENRESPLPISLSSKRLKVKLIIVMLFFLGFYMGGEICSIQFMSSFAQFGDLHLSEAEAGASALSVMTGAFALGRFLGIFVTLKVPPMIILCGNMLLIIGASAVLLLFSGYSLTYMWAGCAILGFGYSTIFPSFIAFMERHLIFTDFLGAVILVGGSVVAMIYPTIVGMLIEQVPLVFTYMNFFTAAVCSVSLLLLRQLTKKKQI